MLVSAEPRLPFSSAEHNFIISAWRRKFELNFAGVSLDSCYKLKKFSILMNDNQTLVSLVV